MRRNKRKYGALAIVATLWFVGTVSAQSTVDTWTQLAMATGAFSPHIDYCDSSTEVFVNVGAGNLGYCIEKAERSAAVWVAAKQDCAEDGKRLPESSEFQYACKNPPTGLTEMTNNFEWTSNFSQWLNFGAGDSVNVAIMGNGNCIYASWGTIASNVFGGTEESWAYRCVR